MTELHVQFDRRAALAGPPARHWPVLKDPAALAALIPQVESIRVTDPERWFVTLHGYRAFGRTIRAAFGLHVDPHVEDDRHVLALAPDDQDTRASGAFVLDPAGEDASTLRVHLVLDLSVPLPRFVAGPARALLVRELGQAMDAMIAGLSDRPVRSD